MLGLLQPCYFPDLKSSFSSFFLEWGEIQVVEEILIGAADGEEENKQLVAGGKVGLFFRFLLPVQHRFKVLL